MPVGVVVAANLRFPGMPTMQPPGVLHQRSAPGNRHGQEQRIQPAIVESLADVTPGRQYEALLIGPKGVQRVQRLPARLLAHASPEYDQMLGKPTQTIGKEVEMIPALRKD